MINSLDFVKVTESAAIAASRWMGRGERNIADGAAVEEMRERLNGMSIAGTVVIGEGERDEAPMLYIGERLGRGGYEVDIAVDPIEGTNLVANGLPNSIAVLAVADRGALLHAPDSYMTKLAVGPKAAPFVDLDAPVAENLQAVSRALDKPIGEICVVILDRPRHQDVDPGMSRRGRPHQADLRRRRRRVHRNSASVDGHSRRDGRRRRAGGRARRGRHQVPGWKLSGAPAAP